MALSWEEKPAHAPGMDAQSAFTPKRLGLPPSASHVWHRCEGP